MAFALIASKWPGSSRPFQFRGGDFFPAGIELARLPKQIADM
jgi:hypothetical protein